MDREPVIVLDTHTLIWWADAGSKLSKKARQASIDEYCTQGVRFRPRGDSPLRDYVTRFTKDDIAWQSINGIANENVCFQPGIGTKGIVIYEIWSCLPLDSAAKNTQN